MINPFKMGNIKKRTFEKNKTMRDYRIAYLLLLLLASISIQAQLPTNEKGEVEYSEVVPLEGLTTEQMYNKAKLWIVSTLKSGDNMVELSGESSDQIVSTGNLVIDDVWLIGGKAGYDAKNIRLNFKFSIFIKEDRYKYVVTNFTLTYDVVYDVELRVIESVVTDLGDTKASILENKKNPEKKEEFVARIKTASDQALKELIKDFNDTMKNPVDDW